MFYSTKITAIKEDDSGTHIKLVIPNAKVQQEMLRYKNGKMINALLKVDDNRSPSAEQIRKFYATIKDISLYTTYPPFYIEELIKYIYCKENGLESVSMSYLDGNMTTARELITRAIEFCFEWDIPIMESALGRAEEIDKYLWLCIKFKKCCICGKKAEIHHHDAIGMGNNRNKLDDSKHRKMALCTIHHQESHKIGKHTFNEKYHVYGIIYKE